VAGRRRWRAAAELHPLGAAFGADRNYTVAFSDSTIVATAITHAFVALAAGKICFLRPMPAKFWLLAVACSVVPDLDVGLHFFGVQYGDLWGHRGMAHSPFFALVISTALVSLLFRREAPLVGRAWCSLAVFFFGVTASHGFIDAFTDGGLGIAFLAPFDHTRYFMPWHPLVVPNFGIASLFSARGAQVLISELLWVWCPLLLVAIFVVLVRNLLFLRDPSEPFRRGT